MQTIPEMIEHPHTKERGLVVSVPKPDGTAQLQIGNPLKFSAGTPAYRHVGRPLGADTRDILQEAGFTPDEIQYLEKVHDFAS
ncbi:MAG: hypothetical protein D6706_21545 [Chloroflexi bacterium]|nr:MAG: hypothetical protein D6706_21545 [Chloroflexota bacterium]